MTGTVGTRAMILAAGLGTRMRPLTLSTPKPLLKVAGKSLIDWAKDNLTQSGIKSIIVNTHYLPEQIEQWAASQPGGLVAISDEREKLLETGGGVVKALPLLGSDPVFILNSDTFWLNASTPAIEQMRERWDDDKMDFLLMLSTHDRATGFDGAGDFFMTGAGQLQRRGTKAGAPFIYAGCYIAHPRALAGEKPVAFSMNKLWDKAIAAGRLYGFEHDGPWLHVGTPDAIKLAEAQLKRFAGQN